MTNARKTALFGNALRAIEYHVDGSAEYSAWENLYKTLSERVGLTDEEILSLGYNDLSGCMPAGSHVKDEGFTDFIDDHDKMFDFLELSKDEFLASYSYLTEAEWRLTKLRVLELCHEATLN